MPKDGSATADQVRAAEKRRAAAEFAADAAESYRKQEVEREQRTAPPRDRHAVKKSKAAR